MTECSFLGELSL